MRASVGDEHGPGFRVGEIKSYIHIVWGEFLALVTGQRGPFQKEGPRCKTKEEVGVCMEFRPLGHPNQGDMWLCTSGKKMGDYRKAAKLIFGATTPIPVSSSWYD